MNYATTCRICTKPLVLSIADEYAELGDPAGLIKMATCNRCHDLKSKRDECHERIQRACAVLISAGSNRKNVEAKLREVLQRLTRRYAEVVAEFHNAQTIYWNPAFAELLMDHPDRWHSILGRFRLDCRRDYKSARQPDAPDNIVPMFKDP